MVVKEGILVAGVVFFVFTISSLVTSIRSDNFVKSFLYIIDNNSDGVITQKELTEFKICKDYDGKKLKKEVQYYGKKADINDLVSAWTPKQILSSVDLCVGDVATASDPSKLKEMNNAKMSSTILKAYDLDNDGEVEWAEFHIGNQLMPKGIKNERQFFRYFDTNIDWKISAKEFKKARPKHISDFIETGKRR